MAIDFLQTDEPVAKVDPEEEYLGGSSVYPFQGGYHTLASHILRLTEMAGPELADLMSLDPKISGSIRTIKNGILGQGMQITATVNIDPYEDSSDLKQSDIDLAFAIDDHCERCWRNMRTSRTELLHRMLDSMRYRTMLGEVVRSVPENGPDSGKYVIDRISVKEPGTWSFALDAYGNVKGIQGDVVNNRDGKVLGKILPREKFIILPWLPRASKPWGQGLLSEAYNAWNMKVQIYPLYWRYLKLFAIPMVHATPPEKAEKRPLMDEDGTALTKDLPPTKVLFRELDQIIRQGSPLLVTPFGATVDLKHPTGDGEAFREVIDLLDREIVYAMHNTTRASMESTRSSRSDAATGQDLLGLVVSYGKWALQEMLFRDLWYPHVAYNWGPEIAEKFTPTVTFGMTNPEDFSKNANAVSRLWAAGVLQGEEERQGLLRYLGLANLIRSRRKSTPDADLSPQPSPNRRAVLINRRRAA